MEREAFEMTSAVGRHRFAGNSLHPNRDAARHVLAGVCGERPVGVAARVRVGADADVAGSGRRVEVVERQHRALRRQVMYLQASVAERLLRLKRVVEIVLRRNIVASAKVKSLAFLPK